MPNLNKVMLMGHLGGNPELKITQGGKKFCNFTLATSEKYKDKEETQWHKIILREKLADLAAARLSKGDCVLIEGKIKYSEYTDKEGAKKYKTEIIGLLMQFVKTKGKPETPPEDKPDTSGIGEPDVVF
jgi:single-strand DNA-binding protein